MSCYLHCSLHNLCLGPWGSSSYLLRFPGSDGFQSHGNKERHLGYLLGKGDGTKNTEPELRMLWFTSSMIVTSLLDSLFFPFLISIMEIIIIKERTSWVLWEPNELTHAKPLVQHLALRKHSISVSCCYDNDIIRSWATIVSLGKFSPSKMSVSSSAPQPFLGLKFSELFPIQLDTPVRTSLPAWCQIEEQSWGSSLAGASVPDHCSSSLSLRLEGISCSHQRHNDVIAVRASHHRHFAMTCLVGDTFLPCPCAHWAPPPHLRGQQPDNQGGEDQHLSCPVLCPALPQDIRPQSWEWESGDIRRLDISVSSLGDTEVALAPKWNSWAEVVIPERGDRPQEGRQVLGPYPRLSVLCEN